MKQVAIVVPNYNRTDQLRESLNSVVNQTFQDFEIVLVDDGSTNDFRSFIPDTLKETIKIVQLPGRSGAARARNAGVEATTAPLVVFLDSDDIWESDKLQLQVTSLQTECDVSFTNYTIETNGTVVPRNFVPVFGKPISSDYLIEYGSVLGGFSGIAVKREWLEKVNGLRDRLRSKQDYDLLIRLAKSGAQIVGLAPSLYIMKKESVDRISASSYNRAQGAISVINRFRDDFSRTKSNKMFVFIRQVIEYLKQNNHPQFVAVLKRVAVAHYLRNPFNLANIKQIIAILMSR